MALLAQWQKRPLIRRLISVLETWSSRCAATSIKRRLSLVVDALGCSFRLEETKTATSTFAGARSSAPSRWQLAKDAVLRGRGVSPSMFLKRRAWSLPRSRAAAGERLVVAPPGPSSGTACQSPTKLFVTRRIGEPLARAVEGLGRSLGWFSAGVEGGLGSELREIASPRVAVARVMHSSKPLPAKRTPP